MAIYHLEGKIISRTQGRSSVAAAAYRSASRFVDERTGLAHDFTKKEPDVFHREILLPEGAPEWMKDRQMLWNHVELIEKRKDAQLARDFNIALPKELTFEQNLALAKEFVQREFVEKGMVADLCLHRGHSHGEDQPHMHVMLSLREVTPKGFGKKVREWNDKALILQWREAWAEYCNQHLALNGHDFRIDHRTLEAQGINLEPQTKIGPKDAAARMARFEEHQRLAERNGRRILKDPSIAFTALTHQQSTFTYQELARFVNRHTATPEQFTQVYEMLKASSELVFLGQDEQGRDRLTTQAMLKLEKTMIQQIERKLQNHTHPVSKWIQSQALKTRSLSDEQKIAYAHLLESSDVASVIGFAGTGKSYMLGAARQAWEQAGYKVQGMTLSGIAAENLEGGSGIQSHTIANRLINWENDRERLTHKDIVVIDEAGMAGSRQMAAIIAEATKASAKVVLVGDIEQLQAIEAGAAFRAITERSGHVEMADIRRQKETWQQAATRQLALKQTQQALSAYQAHDNVHEFETKTSAMTAIIETWQEIRSSEPNKSQIILAYTRDDVRMLNEKARQARKDNGELGKDSIFETHQGERCFAVGDRLYFLRNEKSLGVRNGTLGTLETIQGNLLTVRLDKADHQPSKRIQFHISDYHHIDHGYAATVYKSQGVTVDRSYVLASKYFDRHATYVALSRHRESTDIYWDRQQFIDFQQVGRMLGRERAKDFTLDYARNRGIQQQTQQKNHWQHVSLPERDYLIDQSKVRIELQTPQADRLDSEVEHIIAEAAKKLVALDQSIESMQRGSATELAQRYRKMLAERHQTQAHAQNPLLDKKLDKLALAIYQDKKRFSEIQTTQPKIGKLIQSRAQLAIAKEKNQDIER